MCGVRMVTSRACCPCLAFLLSLTTIGLTITAFVTSNWTEGTEKVRGSVEDYTRKINGSKIQISHWKLYITFHCGYWTLCRESRIRGQEERCDSFIQRLPRAEVPKFIGAIAAECGSICLLLIGLFCQMGSCCSSQPSMHRVAALMSVTSGLVSFLGRIFFIIVLNRNVESDGDIWRPVDWWYGWSFKIGWLAFLCDMMSSIASLQAFNTTTAEINQAKRRAQVKKMEEIIDLQLIASRPTVETRC
ncbi:germ cell-specific gene 1-like protein [Branchiostoma floridae]|uniref:Germ cell-specific gene 1-like protein n=1 Tax=Branchiostoma floridae TaxID=7739 RepID=A0A9J7MKC9_BRAFL|nr:germ cell-specific gene 1-like protein [Branchiostoma floridae]